MFVIWISKKSSELGNGYQKGAQQKSVWVADQINSHLIRKCNVIRSEWLKKKMRCLPSLKAEHINIQRNQSSDGNRECYLMKNTYLIDSARLKIHFISRPYHRIELTCHPFACIFNGTAKFAENRTKGNVYIVQVLGQANILSQWTIYWNERAQIYVSLTDLRYFYLFIWSELRFSFRSNILHEFKCSELKVITYTLLVMLCELYAFSFIILHFDTSNTKKYRSTEQK